MTSIKVSVDNVDPNYMSFIGKLWTLKIEITNPTGTATFILNTPYRTSYDTWQKFLSGVPIVISSHTTDGSCFFQILNTDESLEFMTFISGTHVCHNMITVKNQFIIEPLKKAIDSAKEQNYHFSE